MNERKICILKSVYYTEEVISQFRSTKLENFCVHASCSFTHVETIFDIAPNVASIT